MGLKNFVWAGEAETPDREHTPPPPSRVAAMIRNAARKGTPILKSDYGVGSSGLGLYLDNRGTLW